MISRDIYEAEGEELNDYIYYLQKVNEMVLYYTHKDVQYENVDDAIIGTERKFC